MPRPQVKSFANPDEVRDMANVYYATVNLGEATIGRCRFAPGWRWSVDVGPLFGRTSCPIRHTGYTISGSSHVEMDDGQTLDIGPDTAFDVPPGHDHWVVGDVPWETIEWGGSGRAAQEALEQSTARVLATVLFTDVVDSTRTLERLGDASWRDLLAAHNARLRIHLNVHGGREVKTTGDGVLAVFDSPTRAVRCARDIVRGTSDSGLSVRIGVHTGELEQIGEDVGGIAVHVAARLMALASGDEILVSSTTRDLVEGSSLVLADAGTHELKGVSGARQVYRLVDTEVRIAET
jgi:class 3 adenylate cyclase